CLSCYWRLMPRSPRSTLFPYTTLFRSLAVAGFGERRPQLLHAIAHHRLARFGSGVEFVLDGGQRVAVAIAIGDVERERAIAIGVDRKSTRLNSSHQIISYAVFCLKE